MYPIRWETLLIDRLTNQLFKLSGSWLKAHGSAPGSWRAGSVITSGWQLLISTASWKIFTSCLLDIWIAYRCRGSICWTDIYHYLVRVFPIEFLDVPFRNLLEKVSWFLGCLVCWCLVSGFLDLGVSRFLGFFVSWFLGFKVSWFSGLLVSKSFGFIVYWFQSVFVSCLSFLVSKIIGSKVSMIPYYQSYWIALPCFMFSGRYWSHIQDFQECIRRIVGDFSASALSIFQKRTKFYHFRIYENVLGNVFRFLD